MLHAGARKAILDRGKTVSGTALWSIGVWASKCAAKWSCSARQFCRPVAMKSDHAGDANSTES